MVRALTIQRRQNGLPTSHQLQPLPGLTYNAHFSDYLPTDGACGHGCSQVVGFWEPQFTDSFLGLTGTWPASPWLPGLCVYRPSHSLDFTLNLSAFVPLGDEAGYWQYQKLPTFQNAGHRTTLGNIHYSHPTHHQSSSWFSG